MADEADRQDPTDGKDGDEGDPPGGDLGDLLGLPDGLPVQGALEVVPGLGQVAEGTWQVSLNPRGLNGSSCKRRVPRAPSTLGVLPKKSTISTA